MKYELQTTLGAILDEGETLESVATDLRNALADVLRDPTYASVTHMYVGIEDDREIRVGLRFDGAKAGYVEDTATEILEAAINRIQSSPVADEAELTTEMVSLRPVFA